MRASTNSSPAQLRGSSLCGECQHSLWRANNVSLAAKLAIILIAVGADEWRTGAHRRKNSIEHRMLSQSLSVNSSAPSPQRASSDGTINYIYYQAHCISHTHALGQSFFSCSRRRRRRHRSRLINPAAFIFSPVSRVVDGSNSPWPGNVTS
jgi:hypothetical protein